MGGDACDIFTATSVWPFMARSVIILEYILPCVLVVRVLLLRHQVQRLRSKQLCSTLCRGGDFSLSTLSWVALGAGLTLALHVFKLSRMLGAGSLPGERGIESLVEAFGAMCSILSFLNVGLMWVDICLASKRLQSVDAANLRVTRLVIVLFMICFGALATVFDISMALDEVYPWYYYFVLREPSSAQHPAACRSSRPLQYTVSPRIRWMLHPRATARQSPSARHLSSSSLSWAARGSSSG